MSKAIEQLKSGITVGYAALGLRGGVSGSVRQEVHDGDTINVRAVGNFGIRFLGIDAPEISFTLPGESKFTPLSNNKWETFLSDPFAENFNLPLDQGLIDYLQTRVGTGAAINQYHHATAAEDALEEEVTKDLSVLDQTEESFRFFLAFAYEIMDRYGRFLCFVNRYQPNPAEPAERPSSYNERLLIAGKVSPYFIWPNIDPFLREKKSVFKLADSPEAFREDVNNDATLNAARESFRNARQQKIGIFEANNQLRLEPFEIRFLARRQSPDRSLIDLNATDNLLIKPQEYYTVPNSEDRLFIPEEYVPLFIEKGWQRQT